MEETGKLLVIAGVLLVLVGAGVWGLGRAGFRGLPGDFRYETDHIRIYIPLMTSLLLSLLLSLALWLWQWLSRR